MSTVFKHFALCVGLLFFVPQWIYSQNYVKELATAEDDRVSVIYKLNDSICLVSYFHGDFFAEEYNTSVMELNTRSGNLTLKAELPKIIDIKAEVFFKNIKNDTLHQRYILIGPVYKRYAPYPDDIYKTAILHLSYDYEVLFDTIIGGNDIFYSSILSSNGDLALMSFRAPQLNDWHIIIRKTNIFGSIKQEIVYDYDEIDFVTSFMALPDDNFYICDNHFGYLNYLDTTTLEIVKQDTLHYLDEDSHLHMLTGFDYNKDKDALVYTFMRAKSGHDNETMFMGWDTTTFQNNTINVKYLDIPYRSGAWYHGKTLWIDDNIYMAGTAPMEYNSEHDFAEIDNAVVLQKFSIDGNLMWSRSYMSLNDSMQYSVLPPIEDPNGNIILVADRYKTGCEDYQHDIIYFKVDKDTGNMIEWEQ